MIHITEAQFKSRFISLVLGGSALPKKNEDRHILFISSILALDLDRRYSESEINEALRPWSEKYGGSFGLDHVTLRRFLIDEKYLVRDLAGPSYVLNTSEPPTSYDEAIKELDLDSLFDEARRSREERKRKYTQSADR